MSKPQPAPKQKNTCKDGGVIVPRIDRDRCEGKADCVRVCPYDVFEIGVLPAEQRKTLSFTGKVKGFVHGYRQAFPTHADQCHACGACVVACPEKAIVLARSNVSASEASTGHD
jgi:NAD-dependent dihydropyrimidine dehydrogenase PreA subunit